MPLRNLGVILAAAVLSLLCYQTAQRNRYAAVLADAMRLVDLYYLEEVDRRDLFENAMVGMVGSLDQYSTFIEPETFQAMEESLDQEFGGVGVEVEKTDDQEPLIILSPINGTPAYEAGLRAGDSILAIDGHSTIGMTIKDAVQLMRGKPGTQVRLQVQSVGSEEPIEYTIARRVIVVDSVLGDVRRDDGSWDYCLAQNPRIGYLRMTTFGKHTVEELDRILRPDDSADCPYEGLILDLRGNAGGLLDAAIDVCRLFIDEGTIVSTRGRDGRIRSSYRAQSTTVIPEHIPLAILVNKYSASASEIVAACLQDHGRAVVVGSRTWGKGTVQNLFELEGGSSALKLTTAGYLRPSGKNIHKRQDATDDEDWGVLPDDGYEITLTDEEMQQVFLARRQRDLGKSAEAAGTEDAPGESEQGPVEDSQLLRATDHIEQQLGSASQRRNTA